MSTKFKFRPGVFETTIEGGGFAVDPRRDEDLVSWFDLTHSRAYLIRKVLTDTVDEFRFVDERGRELFVRRLTLTGYLKRIRPAMGGPAFKSVAAVERMVYKVLRGP